MESGGKRQGMVAENQNTSSQAGHDDSLVTCTRTGKHGGEVYGAKPVVETAGCEKHVRWCERGRLETVPYSIGMDYRWSEHR